jgi:hypothetical protein
LQNHTNLSGTIMKKSQNTQTTKISESSEFSGLIAKPYFRSMVNIKIITSGGDGDSNEPWKNPDTQLEYRPLLILLANYAGPQMRRMIAIVNTGMMTPAVEAKSPVPSLSLRLQHSDDDTHNEGPSEVVSPIEVTGPPARRSVSLLNISISVRSIEIEMQISADDSYNATIIVKNKRGSFWKRTKRFFRRLICCCA